MFTCQIVQILNGYIIQFPQGQDSPAQVVYCATMQDVSDYLVKNCTENKLSILHPHND